MCFGRCCNDLVQKARARLSRQRGGIGCAKSRKSEPGAPVTDVTLPRGYAVDASVDGPRLKNLYLAIFRAVIGVLQTRYFRGEPFSFICLNSCLWAYF
jgi:hypothetical protein